MQILNRKTKKRLSHWKSLALNEFRFDDAIKFYEGILPIIITDAENFLCDLGLFYDHKARIERNRKRKKDLVNKAKNFYRQAIRIVPDSLCGLTGLARIYWHQGSRKSVDLYRQVYKRKPTTWTAFNLANAYRKVGNLNLAERLYRKTLKETTARKFPVQMALAKLYLARGDRARAKATAIKAWRSFQACKLDFRQTKAARLTAQELQKILE